MNLRMDLILQSEQRSGSAVNVQSLKRIASVVGPAIALLLLAIVIWKLVGVHHEYKMLTSEWDMTEPQREAAEKHLKAFRLNIGLLKELEGWENASFSWSRQLAGLMKLVPDNVQLDTLRVSQNFQLVKNNTIPARVFGLDLRGKAVGEAAEDSVRRLEQLLKEQSPFESVVDSVKVPIYAADPSKDADRNDRIFGITCTYKNMAFE